MANQADYPENTPLSLDQWIDQVADQFEAAWIGGTPPKLADFLAKESGERRRALLAELVEIDRRYRSQAGETCTWKDYLQEFPELENRAGSPVMESASTTPTVPNPLSAQHTAGSVLSLPGYESLGELGRGGMGVVYKARQVGLNRVVALKMILAGIHASGADMERFQAEAEAIAGLQHPNIVQLHDYGRHNGMPYFTLEFVGGGSLVDKVRDNVLPPREAARIIQHLAEGMAYAHDRSILHRDLKPGNVLLTIDGTPKITDFGLAKNAEVDAGMTATGVVLGTPGYMAPEQASGHAKQASARADIFGLGAILYRLLTGRPPFQGATPLETLQQTVRDEPVPPSRLNAQLPRDLETICLKCLQKEQARRFTSAADLAEDLRRFLAGEPILARRVSAVERVWRWCRRKPALASAIAAIFLALVGGVWLWQAGEASRQKEEHRRLEAELRRQQDASAYREKIGLASDADEQLALAELGAGRFESALKILQTAVARLKKEAGFSKQSARLQATQDRVYRLVQFYKLSMEGELAVAEKFRTKEGDQEARDKFKAALTHLGIFRHHHWWKHLPDADLSAIQRAQLRQEAYRSLHYLAALQCKGGISEFGGGSASSAAMEKALATAAILQRYRPSYSASLLENFCNVRLLHLLRIRLLAGQEPTNAVDAHFAGLIHVWMSGGGTDTLSYWLQKGGKAMGLDTKAPLQTAQRYLRLAASLEPDHYWTNYWLGSALNIAGRYEEAEIALNNCVALRPHYSVGYADRDIALARQYNRAATLAQKKIIHARRLNGLNQALRYLPRNALLYLTRGQAHQHHRDYQKAVAEFDRALKIDPRLAIVHYYRGNALRIQGKLDAAIASFRRAIVLDPKDAEAHNDLGVALNAKGNRHGAIAAYRQAIKVSPNYALPYQNLAIALRIQGDLTGALAAIRRVIVLLPKNAKAHYQLGVILHNQRNLDSAIAAYRLAVKLDPKHAMSQNDLGLALRDKGDLKNAVSALRQAVALEPKNAWIRRMLGFILQSNQDLKGACAAFRHAIKLDPTFVLAHADLGSALWANQDLKGATLAYLTAIELEPQGALTRCHLGLVLRARGKFARALILLRAGHTLGSRQKGWNQPSAQWVRDCQRLVELEGRLPDILSGQTKPANPAEQIELARMCVLLRRHGLAARCYEEAFAAKPELADDLHSLLRYHAARAAALAGCGQSNDRPALDESKRTGWRKQALAWLRADLMLWRKRTTNGDAQARGIVPQSLRKWQQDKALAGLRDSDNLGRLPAAERESWRKFWEEVKIVIEGKEVLVPTLRSVGTRNEE